MKPYHLNNVLFTREQIQSRIDGLVEEMAETCRVDNLVLIGVLRGSFMFFADLVRDLYAFGIHPRIDFMTLESYHGGTSSSGMVRITKDISVDVTDADVLLVDDILDTGRTMTFARRHLANKGARTVRSCVLLDKPSRRVADVDSEFSGFTIEDLFVVGYGLDFDARHRELPYITTVTFEE